MSDITDRLERLYVDTGANYVQEAAREIRNLRAEVAGLRELLANIIEKRCKYGWGFETDAAIDAALAARKGTT